MKRAKTVLVTAPEKEMDPHLLLLDGRDVRSVSRRERRSHGFRGAAFRGDVPALVRYVRRHAGALTARTPTRRIRKQRARIRRLVAARGLR